MRGWSDGEGKDIEAVFGGGTFAAVRMVLEHGADHASQWAAIGSIAARSAHGETLRSWVRQAERDQGLGPVRPVMSGSRSRAWNARTASRVSPTRFCERRRRILRWRSSTAGQSHDRVHRRASRRLWGRADLPGSADRPVHLSCRCRKAGRSGEAVCPARRDAAVQGDIQRVWEANFQLLACARSGGSCSARPSPCRAVSGAADETDGPCRRRAWQNGENHPQRSIGAMPAGPGEPAVPGAGAEHLVGVGLHLRRHLAGLCLCRLRHRRLRPPHRRLARIALGAADFVLEPWSKPCAIAARSQGGLCITAIAASNTSRSATPSAWPKPVSSLQWAASATATTTRSPRP